MSKSATSRNHVSDSDDDNEPADYGTYANDMDINGADDLNEDHDAEDHGSPLPPSPRQERSPRRTSFAQIDQFDVMEDEQQDDESEGDPPETPSRVDKGKRKATLDDIQEEEAEAAEHEVEEGLNDAELSGSEQEPEPSPPPKKKLKFAQEKERPKKVPSSQSKKENRGGSIP